jgi:hypothetical protein
VGPAGPDGLIQVPLPAQLQPFGQSEDVLQAGKQNPLPPGIAKRHTFPVVQLESLVQVTNVDVGTLMVLRQIAIAIIAITIITRNTISATAQPFIFVTDK